MTNQRMVLLPLPVKRLLGELATRNAVDTFGES